MKKEAKHMTFLKSITYVSTGIEAKFYTDDNALWLERRVNDKKQYIYLDSDQLDFLFKVLKEIEYERRN